MNDAFRTYDVVAIDAGPVGENVADRARAAGLSTVIVERELLGGECSFRSTATTLTAATRSRLAPAFATCVTTAARTTATAHHTRAATPVPPRGVVRRELITVRTGMPADVVHGRSLSRCGCA
ncbi:hypothetical protein [Streptomyces sp. Tue6028]|uniref:hypothetical protein n=1 Tax=Streptomyces sp. Tue6028 TaxID=2036037 RepID=UPI003F49FAD8